MKRSLITTSDGSCSLIMEDWGETYHSVHGAIQEAKHVYIAQGLDGIDKQHVAVLEMGFGTGLNAYLTLLRAQEQNKHITYHTIEAYPLTNLEIKGLNYPTLSQSEAYQPYFDRLHSLPFDQAHQVTEHFDLYKMLTTFEKAQLPEDYFDVVYYDAFGYQYQPELWSLDLFKKVFNALKKGGKLATYASRGVIRRTMLEAGFTVEKKPGPIGKREILVATKPL